MRRLPRLGFQDPRQSLWLLMSKRKLVCRWNQKLLPCLIWWIPALPGLWMKIKDCVVRTERYKIKTLSYQELIIQWPQPLTPGAVSKCTLVTSDDTLNFLPGAGRGRAGQRGRYLPAPPQDTCTLPSRFSVTYLRNRTWIVTKGLVYSMEIKGCIFKQALLGWAGQILPTVVLFWEPHNGKKVSFYIHISKSTLFWIFSIENESGTIYIDCV